MRNMDWSSLDIGKSWKWGVVLFKSNCIILRHYHSHYLVIKRQQNNPSNISIEANIVDPDPIGAVWYGSTLFIYEASNSWVDDKSIQFVIMRFKG